MRHSLTTSIFTLIFSFALISIFTSCKEATENKAKPTTVIDDDTTKQADPRDIDTISCETFNDWTKRWRRKGQQFTADNNVINYYDLPIEDLKEVIKEMPAGSRFFLGLDSSQTGGGKGVITYTPHLVVVGTDSNGEVLYDPANGQNIYDVSRPCPPYCPSSSDTIQCN